MIGMIIENRQVTHQSNKFPNGIADQSGRYIYYSKGSKFKYELGSYKVGGGWAVELDRERISWARYRVTPLEMVAIELRELIEAKAKEDQLNGSARRKYIDANEYL